MTFRSFGRFVRSALPCTLAMLLAALLFSAAQASIDGDQIDVSISVDAGTGGGSFTGTVTVGPGEEVMFDVVESSSVVARVAVDLAGSGMVMEFDQIVGTTADFRIDVVIDGIDFSSGAALNSVVFSPTPNANLSEPCTGCGLAPVLDPAPYQPNLFAGALPNDDGFYQSFSIGGPAADYSFAYTFVSLSATLTDAILADDGDGAADPGETLRYTSVVTNGGSELTSMVLTNTLDANTTPTGAVHVSPLALPDTFTCIGNVGISVPAVSGVLANDIDVDGPSLSVVAAAGGTTAGGAFSITSNGSFAYLPPAGFEGTDSFNYTLTDGDALTPNDVGTVTIEVSDVIWFIDHTAGAGGTGVLSNPFNSTGVFMAVNDGAANHPGDDDLIFVYEKGAGPYIGTVTLRSGQTLIGQGATSSVAVIGGFAIPPHSNALPSTGGSKPRISPQVYVSNGSSLHGLVIGTPSPTARPGAELLGCSSAICRAGVVTDTLVIRDVTIDHNRIALGPFSGVTFDAVFDSIRIQATAGAIIWDGLDGTITVLGPTRLIGSGLRVTTCSADIDFAGGVFVTTTGVEGIFMSGNTDTVSIGGTASWVQTTNGKAVDVSSTDLGSGWTFERISSSSAHTAGITLANVTGSFTVTGDGSTNAFGNGSGGTITNAITDGITLTNVSDISLANMVIDNSGRHGIFGTNVTHFELSYSSLTGNGDAVNEDGIHFSNLLGLASAGKANRIVNSRVRQSENHNVFVSNTTQSSASEPDQLTISGCEIRSLAAPNGSNGVLHESGSGARMRLVVSNTTFLDNRGTGLNVQAAQGGVNDVTVTGSSFTSTNTGAGAVTDYQDVGISIGATQTSSIDFDIAGNTPFTSRNSDHVSLSSFDTAQLTGLVRNNTNMNGSINGSGVRAVSEGGSSIIVEISGNTIGGLQFGRGIDLQARQGSGSLQATVTGNNINTAIPSAALADDGLYAAAGTGSPGESNVLCLDVSGNTSQGGTGLSGYRLRQFSGTTFRIEGLTPASGATTGQVETYVVNQNTSGTANASGTFVAGTCTTPATPPVVAESGLSGSLSGSTDSPRNAALELDARLRTQHRQFVELPPVAEFGRERPGFTAELSGGHPLGPHSPNPSITVSIGSMPSGKSLTVLYDTIVNAAIPPGVVQLSSQGTVTATGGLSVLTDDPDVSGTADPTTTPLAAAPDLVLAKTDDVTGTAAPGDLIRYRLAATNSGNQIATGTIFTETVPVGTTFDASNSSINWSCSDGDPAGTVCTLDFGALADIGVGHTGVVAFAVEVVPAPGVTAIINTASVADDGANGADPTPGNNSKSITTALTTFDFGDAPDPFAATGGEYPTLLASDGARHVLGSGLFLGTSVDLDIDGQPDATGTGDDNDAEGDDDDGVSFPTLLAVGQTGVVNLSASAAGHVDAWVDFNQDGDWDDAGEQIFTSIAVPAGANQISFVIPATARSGKTFARFRFSSAGGLSPTGLSNDGEVEDYEVAISELDFGDAPDPVAGTAGEYPTLLANDGARHILGSGIFLGTSVDAEADGQPDATGTGDDLDAEGDDDDGVTFVTPIVPGRQMILQYTAPKDAIVSGFIDYNGDGDWDDAGESIGDVRVRFGQIAFGPFVPPTARPGATFARFRISSTATGPSGLASDGEVEDYRVHIVEPVSLENQIAMESDDAEQDPDGSMSLSSSDLELTQDGSNTQKVGIRFKDLAIPPGAIILSANIQFQADESDAVPTDLTIQGQLVPNAPTFTETDFDISSRTALTAPQSWSPALWVAGEAGFLQRTPDLKDILQEIINQPGWAYGNAAAFIICGTGKRTAESFDGDEQGAPKLIVEYALIPDFNMPPVVNAGPDQEVTLPAKALLDGTVSDDGLVVPPGAVSVEWKPILAPSTVTFDDAFSVDTQAEFGGPGTYILCLTADDGEKTTSDSTTVTVLPAGTTQMWMARVAHDDDDAEQDPDGSMSLTSSDLELVEDGDPQTIGVRWRNVQVPPGATIVSACIQFQADESQAGQTDLTFRGELVLNAAPYSEIDNDISSRAATTQSVDWNNVPAWSSGDQDAAQKTPDLKDIIQPIISQGGWQSGNALAVIITGGGKRVAESFDGESDGAAKLIIEYSAGTGTSGNLGPVVDAGSGQTVTTPPSSVMLDGTVNDDGLPLPSSLTTRWTDTGPATVVFDDPQAVDTKATFPVPGIYVLRLAASDGAVTTADTMTVHVLPSGATAMLTRTISHDDDDAEEDEDGDVDLNSSDLELVERNGGLQVVGMRFRNITIPRGASITSACLQLQADEKDDELTHLAIMGQASDDAQPFAETPRNISSRARTEMLPWLSVPAWDETGERAAPQKSPDLREIIQSIVRRGGWQSGHAIALIVIGTGKRVAESRDGEPDGAPTLLIEYTTPAPARVVEPAAFEPLVVGIAETRAVVAPNPMRGQGTLRLSLAKAGAVRLRVFDIQGRQVQAATHSFGVGEHVMVLGRERGRIGPGLYFYRIEAPDAVLTGRFMAID